MAYDLVILGDTPDAWDAAREAANLGRRCAVLRPDFDGGLSSGVNSIVAAFGGGGMQLERERTVRSKPPREMWQDAVGRQERLAAQLANEAGVRVLRGPTRLAGTSSAEVFISGAGRQVEGDLLLIATGTVQRKRRGVWGDGDRFFAPEDVSSLGETPRRLAVLGGSLTAIAFARFFVSAGASVTVIDPEVEFFGPSEFRSVQSRIQALHKTADGVTVQCASGESIGADAVLCADRRIGATATLGLAIADLEADDEGRLWCDDLGFTWQPTIAAAGEVVGFPQEIARDPGAARRFVALQFPCRIAGRIDAGREALQPMSRRRPVPRPHGKTSAPLLKLYEATAGNQHAGAN